MTVLSIVFAIFVATLVMIGAAIWLIHRFDPPSDNMDDKDC
jgi:hypothetical protein